MGIYRNISTKFWSDPGVVQNFSPEDKYFFMYLLTNEHTTLCGTLNIGTKMMANETGYSEETIKALIERQYTVHKTILFSQEDNEILIRRWCKYNWTSSPKLVEKLNKQLRDVKSTLHRSLLETLISAVEKGYSLDTLSIPYRYPSVTVSVSDTDIPNDSNTNIPNEPNSNIPNDTIPHKPKKEPAVKKPKPPKSFADVEDYAKERGVPHLAKGFWDYYDAGDWYDGKGEPVLAWKQKFVTWQQREEKKNGSSTAHLFEKAVNRNTEDDFFFVED